MPQNESRLATKQNTILAEVANDKIGTVPCAQVCKQKYYPAKRNRPSSLKDLRAKRGDIQPRRQEGTNSKPHTPHDPKGVGGYRTSDVVVWVCVLCA